MSKAISETMSKEIQTYQALVLDMDGVLWHGDTPIAGLKALFNTLATLNLPFMLATNNAMKRAVDYVEKLERFGVSVPAECILTSGEATAAYMRQTYPEAQQVYVVGETALQKAVAAQGFEVLSPEDIRAGARAPLVVAGLTRNLSYDLLAMATLLVHEGAAFIATNPDTSIPTELGPLPGAGALQAVITAATGVKPIVIGKPEPSLFLEALRRLGTEPAVTAMVGDRLGTDIAGAQAAGLDTILVLSGISSQVDIETTGIQPDFVIEHIGALTAMLVD